MDFISDRTANGNQLKILTFRMKQRGYMAFEVDTSLTGKRVCGALIRVGRLKGYPMELLTDNGSEFIGNTLDDRCINRRVDHLSIDPTNPSQNGSIECLNGELQAECLNQS